MASATELNIHQFSELTIAAAAHFIAQVELTDQQRKIAVDVVREIDSRLQFLVEVGLGYLTLNRESGTLSGGEAQRIRLATQIGSGLAGVLYVLDEPSIGLHQRDNARLLTTLRRLRDLGNSVIVVEHDEETIRAADYILDLGPGAGPRGGNSFSAVRWMKCWERPRPACCDRRPADHIFGYRPASNHQEVRGGSRTARESRALPGP